MDHKEDEEKQWVAVQKKTFVKWTNNHLVRKGYGPIDGSSLETQFEDGIKLMEIVNALYNIPMPKHNAHPKMRPHKLDNLTLAFKMKEDAQIKTNFLKTTHLIDGDLKMLLGMLWAIILDYAIKGISVDELTAKEGLLLWVRKKTAGYRDVDPPGVSNFSTSWKDGMALCALIHRHRPDLINYDSLDRKNAADNLELAFSVAEKDLGIPRLLEVPDLTEVARPDERSVMTYISEFFHRFARQDIREQAAKRVRTFIEFMRRMEEQQFAYESRARALIEWINGQTNSFAEGKFGDTVGEAHEALANFRQFVVAVKPTKAGEKLDVESLYAEIQTELAVNGRHAYVPPHEVTPDQVEQHWGKLLEAETAYGKRVRDNRFRFIEKKESVLPKEKLDEWTAAFNHFDKNGNGVLDKVEFKACLSALGVPFKDDAAFEEVFKSVSQGSDKITLEQYINYNKALNEDKDSPDQVKASFKMIADQGDGVTAEQLRMPPLTDDDVQFLLTKMQQKDGKYDYNGFVDSVFVQNN